MNDSYREGYRDGYRDGQRDALAPNPNDKCPGCGTPAGMSCWDNCRLHPPFSQPKYLGNGAYEMKGDRSYR